MWKFRNWDQDEVITWWFAIAVLYLAYYSWFVSLLLMYSSHICKFSESSLHELMYFEHCFCCCWPDTVDTWSQPSFHTMTATQWRHRLFTAFAMPRYLPLCNINATFRHDSDILHVLKNISRPKCKEPNYCHKCLVYVVVYKICAFVEYRYWLLLSYMLREQRASSWMLIFQSVSRHWTPILNHHRCFRYLVADTVLLRLLIVIAMMTAVDLLKTTLFVAQYIQSVCTSIL